MRCHIAVAPHARWPIKPPFRTDTTGKYRRRCRHGREWPYTVRTIRATFYRRPPPIGSAAPTVACGKPRPRLRSSVLLSETSFGLAFRQQRFRRDCHIATGMPCVRKPLSRRDRAGAARGFSGAGGSRCCEPVT